MCITGYNALPSNSLTTDCVLLVTMNALPSNSLRTTDSVLLVTMHYPVTH